MENLLRRLDFTSLRLFVAVCQEKNIARAAEREFIASSAISRRIADIEALIGLPVIERHQRGITITPAGETVLYYANRIIADVEALGAELSRFFSGAKGNVHLAANISSLVQFLPEDLAAFHRIFPDIRIDLEEQHSDEVMSMVEERSVDLGICLSSSVTGDVETLPYRTDRLALLVPRTHRLASRNQIAYAEMLDEPFVALKTESALTAQMNEKARLEGRDLDVQLRVNSLDALCRMVHVGLGVAVVPQMVGELYINTLNVEVIPLSDDWGIRELVMVFRSRAQLSATANTLVEFLAAR
uniref:LysR family transcriptional regulator n=1 Tax=Marinobacterium profundum TaxID=1714300 RepID=UPI000833BFEC|nr:LysR family transcriptional regulator [Marinobacterium profundum]